jgi:hypothetical protein
VARKVNGDIVVFQADELDAATSSRWSVTVTGRARLVTDADAVARQRTVPLVPWAPGARDQFVTITTELAEGRRVRRPPAMPGDEPGVVSGALTEPGCGGSLGGGRGSDLGLAVKAAQVTMWHVLRDAGRAR